MPLRSLCWGSKRKDQTFTALRPSRLALSRLKYLFLYSVMSNEGVISLWFMKLQSAMINSIYRFFTQSFNGCKVEHSWLSHLYMKYDRSVPGTLTISINSNKSKISKDSACYVTTMEEGWAHIKQPANQPENQETYLVNLPRPRTPWLTGNPFISLV